MAGRRARLVAAIDPSDLRPPDCCPGCGRPSTTVVTVPVHRDMEIDVMSHERSRGLPVPVCSICKWRRVVAGSSSSLAALAVTAVAAVIAVTAAVNQSWALTGTFGGCVAMTTIFSRVWLDEVVTWRTLGLHISSAERGGRVLLVRFRHAHYARAWLAANPRAAIVRF